MNARMQALPSDPTEASIARDSTMLRELYFATLGGDGATMEPPMSLALAASFGSVERWREQFAALGRALGGGSGWVALTFQPREGTLVNQSYADPAHDLASGVPVLALDMSEQARGLDPGAAGADAVAAFMQSIDWAGVYERYQAAVSAATESIGASADEAAAASAFVIDVRRAGAFEKASTMLPGARWFDPAGVGRWAAALPQDREIVVYCVYGHEVGRSTALRLRAAGLNARYLRGGIDGWQAAGRPVVPKPPRGEAG